MGDYCLSFTHFETSFAFFMVASLQKGDTFLCILERLTLFGCIVVPEDTEEISACQSN